MSCGVACRCTNRAFHAAPNPVFNRDLKPDNIKIKGDGTVKVLDFGLAKVGATPIATESENSPTFSMNLTQTGVLLGTAAYMSPEPARGKAVDARSDIWAFGVVLHSKGPMRYWFSHHLLNQGCPA